MIKQVFTFVVIASFLMSCQCVDVLENTLEFDSYKVNITPASSFSLNDTIWIKGKVSSHVYDLSKNDSIFNEKPLGDIFSIYKFIEPTQASNCIDAIDKFELIFDIGEYLFDPSCENASMQAIPVLAKNGSFYTYRIGLRPSLPGDFVVSWRNAAIQNEDRNEFIIESYPIEDHPNGIGFISCEDIFWRYTNESEREYYFTIE